MDGDASSKLGEVLDRVSRLPYDRAQSMPAAFYIDQAVLEVEQRELFRREWICVGRREELNQAGDFMALNLGGEPVLVVRDEEGTLRAFSNVCRHRGAVIAEGKGNARFQSCPYHGWTYDAQGRLLGTPGIPKREDFDRANCRLPEFACRDWLGFVFVSLAADPPPLEPRLAALEARIRNYHLEETTLRYVAEEVWDTNWKCFIENFMEGYHLSPLHRETLHPVNPTRLCRHFPPGEAFFGYNAGFDASLPRPQKGHPDLSDEEATNCVMFAVPPGLVVGCAADYSSFVCVQPESPDRLRAKMGLIFFGPDWPQDRVDWAVGLFQRTMAEDKAVLVRLKQGLHSSFHRPGPLASADREGTVRDFYAYLNRRMGAALAR
jgi:phenylpropionate dioxygenase-like ring-hydroxylating dioxygenase large terminal subunit